MARGRLAKIGMLRRLIRVKSTLPRRPSPSLCRVSLRRVSPRRAAPPAAPLLSPRRSSRYRGAFTRPARWHGASARSRPAQRAITPQQWSQRAITPQQWSQRAGTPQQWSQRAITPQQWSQRAGTPQQWSQRAGTPHPRPLRVEIRVALHPAESVATLRHRYRHSIRLSVQFVATDCTANRHRSVSSRLGHLYVSKERQGPGRLGRRLSPTAAPAARACFVALRALMCVMCHMPVLRCRQAANT